ncbi:uncharacterized protein LOC126841013 [Adelges cooleyi]|uniref:uncharacterized protein LOC126841013 n=1 Tax=Adelges cooleyi TaxID=133065 RepID=UPI00217F3B89|nr:uncharacterized protein LOC126841013 [Adelges cooleyi]
MKSNMNLMLFAVFFGLIISLNATPVTTDEGETLKNESIPECLKSHTSPMVKSVSYSDLNKMPTCIFNLQKHINDISVDLLKKDFESSIPLKLHENFLKMASYARTLIQGKCTTAGREVLSEAIRDCFDPFNGDKLEIIIKEVVDRFVREVQNEPVV